MLSIILFIFLIKTLEAKKRVILFGIDGLNPTLIKHSLSNKNINFLRQNGAWTYKARTTIQTTSAPGWSSILCSLGPTSTGIVNDDWLPPWNFKKTKITPVKGDKKPFPWYNLFKFIIFL